MDLTPVGRVILGAVRRKSRSGYEIKRLVDRSTRFFWAASYGQIYPELRRLEAEGLIAGTSKPHGARPRTVYRVTPRGRRALRTWLLTPDAGYEVRDEGLLKLFFADALTASEALALVRNLRANRHRVLDRLLEIQSDVSVRRPRFPSLVLEYGTERHRWEVEWLERLERRLAAQTKEVA